MASHTVTLGPLDLAPGIESFGKLVGDRPVMLSYKISKVIEELSTLRDTFLERVRPYLDDQGHVRSDLTEEETPLFEEIINEKLQVELPEIQLTELGSLTVSDDAAIFHLTRTGIVTAE